MRIVTITRAEIARQAARRPDGYTADVLAAAAGEDEVGVTVDTDSDAYRALAEKYPPLAPPIRGLGDLVARVTSAMGIKPCGKCGERQAALNGRFPAARPPL